MDSKINIGIFNEIAYMYSKQLYIHIYTEFRIPRNSSAISRSFDK